MKKENKVFIDTEFIESFILDEKGRPFHNLDLISIGLVKENGDSYQALSNEYVFENADDWFREKIITPIYIDANLAAINYINYTNFHKFSGKSKAKIAEEIKDFVGVDPVFYGFYSSHDHVVLSSLYGKIFNLPDGWSLYMRDIKQIMDGFNIKLDTVLKGIPQTQIHDSLKNAQWIREAYILIKKKIDK